MANALRFIRDHQFDDYLITAVTKHAQSLAYLPKMVLNPVWSQQDHVDDLDGPPTFFEGKINTFFL